MSLLPNSDPTMATLQADVTALKQDLSSLLMHLKTGAVNGAQAASGQIDDGAQKLYRAVAAEGEQSLKALGQRVEQRPLLALLIMLGVGFASGRLLPR